MPAGCARPSGGPDPCGKLPAMNDLLIEVPTEYERLSDLREVLDRELAGLAPGLLETHWEAETLHLTGPGAAGTLDLRGGQLVARARLAPPASLMRPMIETRMTRLLQSLATRADV